MQNFLLQYLPIPNIFCIFVHGTRMNKILMKRTLSFILVCGLCLTGCLAQKQDGKVVAKYLINGYFFETMPELPAEVMEKGTVFPLMTDKDGLQVQAIRLDTELPDSIVRMALPKKRVKNAWFFVNGEKELRRQANTAIADGTGPLILPKVGNLLPIFRERDMNGKMWDNRELGGHVSVFYLWYQGSVQALSEMNELAAWKVMYPDVQFFSVTWHDVATVRRLTQQYNFNWIHLCNAHQLMTWVNQGVDEKNASARDYPVTIVVDQQGYVRRVVSGTSMEIRRATLDCILQYR